VNRRLRHLPGLDGVRGLAVVAVLLFHGGVLWAGGGFLGVDAFFVLSGYLITRLLIEERSRAGCISLRGFWARRVRRLFPALLALLLLVCLYAAFLATPDTRHRLRLDAMATLGYIANWRLAASGTGYFDRLALPSPLQHTWSLAIEEQFYLLWPLTVVAAFRWARRPLRTLLVIAGGAALASAVAMAGFYSPGSDPSRIYYGTDTRAQSVLFGVALALLLAGAAGRPVDPSGLRRRGRWLLEVAGGTGAAFTAWAWTTATGGSPWLYRGGFAVCGIAVAAVLTDVVLVPEGLLARILSVSPLQVLGRISYGLYLWHWPIFLAINGERTSLPGPALLGLRLAVTLAVSLLSFRFLELPVRRGAIGPRRAAVALPAAVALTVAAVLAVTAVPAPPAPAAVSAFGPDGAPPRATSAPATAPLPVRAHRRPGAPVRVLLLGDSVALTLGQGLPARDYGVELVNRAVLGCGVVRGGPFRYFGSQYDARPWCQDWPRLWAADLASTGPDVVAVLLGRWEVMDRVYAGRWTHVGDPAFDGYLLTELDRAVIVLSARGSRVALLTAPYYKRGERPDGGRWPEDDPARVDRFDLLLRQVAARHTGTVTLVDLGRRMGPAGRYTDTVAGVKLRYDGVHVTGGGARWLAPWLLPQLTALARL